MSPDIRPPASAALISALPESPPYLVTGWTAAPQATLEALAHGEWLLRCPVPPVSGMADDLPELWSCFSRRRGQPGAMFAQRMPTGDTDQQAPWRTISWAQAWQVVQHISAMLKDLGYGPDRPIATLSGNAIEQALLRLAAFHGGITLVHCSPAWSLLSRDHAALKAAFALTAPAAVMVQDGLAFSAAIEALRASGFTGTVIAVTRAQPDQLSWASLCKDAPATDSAVSVEPLDVPGTTVIGVYFTSGSTGSPKAVPVTRDMIDAQTRMTNTLTSPAARGEQVVLDWLPWHHVFGGIANLGRFLTQGGTYYIDEGRPIAGQFEATLRNLRDVAPTNYTSSPIAFSRLADALESDDMLARQFFSRLQCMAYGGASLAQETWSRLQVLAVRHRGAKIPFLCGLGATETAATGLSLYWASDDTAGIGLPLPGCDLKLVPLQGQGDACAGRFEMRMRGPHIFRGYLGTSVHDATGFDEDGYYCLGDAVKFVDPDNILRGLRFAGRVAEDFKLATGTWVSAGTVRVAALTRFSPLALDALVCGHDREELGMLLWPNIPALRALSPELAELALTQLLRHPLVLGALRQRLLAPAKGGSAATIERVGLLDSPASLELGELTDKGYVNQARARLLRAKDIEWLYQEPTNPRTVSRASHAEPDTRT